MSSPRRRERGQRDGTSLAVVAALAAGCGANAEFWPPVRNLAEVYPSKSSLNTPYSD